jgi:hypothetical protein
VAADGTARLLSRAIEHGLKFDCSGQREHSSDAAACIHCGYKGPDLPKIACLSLTGVAISVAWPQFNDVGLNRSALKQFKLHR